MTHDQFEIFAVTDEEVARCHELRVIGCRFIPPQPADLLLPSGRPDPRAKKDPHWGWREITLRPLLFGNWQLCIGPRGCEIGFDRGYMYASFDRAVHALACWMPDHDEHPPAGWHRDDSTGERRPLVH